MGGPKHVVKRGKTPVLKADEARALFDSIPVDTIVGLRDRAVIGVICYSFARVSATVGMRVEDYYQQGKRWWFRLHEKGRKRHEVPAHHKADEYLDAYLRAAGIENDKKSFLFRSVDKTRRRLTENPMSRVDVLRMPVKSALFVAPPRPARRTLGLIDAAPPGRSSGNAETIVDRTSSPPLELRLR